jgi:hypothetical protein
MSQEGLCFIEIVTKNAGIVLKLSHVVMIGMQTGLNAVKSADYLVFSFYSLGLCWS